MMILMMTTFLFLFCSYLSYNAVKKNGNVMIRIENIEIGNQASAQWVKKKKKKKKKNESQVIFFF